MAEDGRMGTSLNSMSLEGSSEKAAFFFLEPKGEKGPHTFARLMVQWSRHVLLATNMLPSFLTVDTFSPNLPRLSASVELVVPENAF